MATTRRVERSSMANHPTRVTLEDYTDFFFNPSSRYQLNLLQVNQIVNMHAFFSFKTKKEALRLFASYDLMSPLRSTLGDRRVSPAPAEKDLDAVKDDLWSIGWEECPIGSVVGVGGRGEESIEAAASVFSPGREELTRQRPLSVSPSVVVPRKQRRKRMRMLCLMPPPMPMSEVGVGEGAGW